MINIIRSKDRHTADHGWLLTHWHFSFSDYHDPANMNWGALRVFNDDIIRAGGGFGAHPHRDMEIVTYVLDGQLEHQDSLKNRGVIHPGEVQVMSAGKGITHAEYNHSKEKDVHLIQLWILPRHKNNTPRWEQRQFTPNQRQGRLLPVVSSGDLADTLAIDQDARIYISSLQKTDHPTPPPAPRPQPNRVQIAGQLTLNGQQLNPGDQARIADESQLALSTSDSAELILLDLPQVEE
jgi:hypothetical protein